MTDVDHIPYMLHPALAGFEVSWSSDSRWLAYSKSLDTQLSAVFLYDTESAELHQATSGYYSDSSPVFDPDGDYLYYLSNRSLQAVYSDFDATWVYPNSTGVVAAPLRADVASLLLPHNDEEESEEEADDEADEEADASDDASGFELVAKGSKMLVARRGGYFIVDARPRQELGDAISTDDLQTTLEPLAEWRQIFNDIRRAYRDFFYDPSMHGVDWEAMRELYGTLVEHAVTRWDVNFLLGELIGEVNASHTYVGGGDTESAASRPVGLLGVDWELDRADGGAYRIGRVVRGAPWDIETRSALREPGIKVSAGEYVLAVNGRPMDTSVSPHAAFEGLAGETVALTVNDRPTTDGAREVIVRTLTSDARLRHLEWIEANRRRVDEASGGRVGYVFVPNTGVPGQTELVRQLTSQVRKEGLIVDERFNAGGQLPDRFIETFNRNLVNRIYFRSGDIVNQPNVGLFGAKVMLINGWAGSGGDAFPYFFKTLGVGPIIGERTWGGLIGPAVGHQTIDGGRYTAPPGRIYGPDGEWFAEGHGVEPDLLVVDDPAQLARGVGPQLEAAIQEALGILEGSPMSFPGRPAFERRTARDREQ